MFYCKYFNISFLYPKLSDSGKETLVKKENKTTFVKSFMYGC